jgi:hypothetical protein
VDRLVPHAIRSVLGKTALPQYPRPVWEVLLRSIEQGWLSALGRIE